MLVFAHVFTELLHVGKSAAYLQEARSAECLYIRIHRGETVPKIYSSRLFTKRKESRRLQLGVESCSSQYICGLVEFHELEAEVRFYEIFMVSTHRRHDVARYLRVKPHFMIKYEYWILESLRYTLVPYIPLFLQSENLHQFIDTRNSEWSVVRTQHRFAALQKRRISNCHFQLRCSVIHGISAVRHESLLQSKSDSRQEHLNNAKSSRKDEQSKRGNRVFRASLKTTERAFNFVFLLEILNKPGTKQSRLKPPERSSCGH